MPTESEERARDILHIAVRNLAIGRGPIAEQLRYAYTDGLHRLPPARLPWDDLREPLRDILDYLGSHGRGGLSIDQIPDDDLIRVAGELFDLYGEVNKRTKD